MASWRMASVYRTLHRWKYTSASSNPIPIPRTRASTAASTFQVTLTPPIYAARAYVSYIATTRNGVTVTEQTLAASAGRPSVWWSVVRDAVRGVPHDYTAGSLGRGIVLLHPHGAGNGDGVDLRRGRRLLGLAARSRRGRDGRPHRVDHDPGVHGGDGALDRRGGRGRPPHRGAPPRRRFRSRRAGNRPGARGRRRGGGRGDHPRAAPARGHGGVARGHGDRLRVHAHAARR